MARAERMNQQHELSASASASVVDEGSLRASLASVLRSLQQPTAGRRSSPADDVDTHGVHDATVNSSAAALLAEEGDGLNDGGDDDNDDNGRVWVNKRAAALLFESMGEVPPWLRASSASVASVSSSTVEQHRAPMRTAEAAATRLSTSLPTFSKDFNLQNGRGSSLAADVDGDAADEDVVLADRSVAADEKTFRFDVDRVYEEEVVGEGEDATTRLLAEELAAQQRRADAARAALVQHMTQRQQQQQQQQQQQELHMHRGDDGHLAGPSSPQRSLPPSMPTTMPAAPPAWAAEFSPPPPPRGSLRASNVRALAAAAPAASATTAASLASLASPPRQGAVPTPTAWEPPASPTQQQQQQQQSRSEGHEEEHCQEGEEGDEYGRNQERIFLPRPSPSPLAAVYAYESGPLQPHDSLSRREENDMHDVAETVALLAPAAARVLAELSPPNVVARSGA